MLMSHCTLIIEISILPTLFSIMSVAIYSLLLTITFFLIEILC